MMDESTVSARRPDAELKPGATFGGYRILRLLGHGGMGLVYAAERTEDGRVVALKVLAQDLDSHESRRRFLREGRLAASLNHPNAVYVYGTEEIAGAPAISMELVAGGTLEERVRERGPLPVEEAVESILQVIEGLQAAQKVGVLHRDVKPSNCFVAIDGTVKIGDFGLSKPVEGVEQSRITKTGLFVGTPVYSSPEQLLGEPLDARSDLYAVGVTLYYLLTGELPYEADNVMQLVAMVLNGSPVSPDTHRNDLPRQLTRVVLRAIARKPGDRFADYSELRAALERFRPAAADPAPLIPRFVAGAINDVVVAAAAAAATLALPAPLRYSNDPTPFAAAVAYEVLSLGLLAVLVAVPEGIWGTSIGKWLFGLRVMGRASVPAGVPRSLLRALVYWLPGGLAYTVVTYPTGIYDNWLGMLLFPAFAGTLFVTMRRHNGFAALQDLASDTRVLLASRARAGRQASFRAVASTAPPAAGSERIGAYRVVQKAFDTEDGGSVVLGIDRELNRQVWIHLQPAGMPPLSEARRQVARRTRLRWLGGRRTPTETWDAYEAPWGGPIGERAGAPMPWELAGAWLEDLTAELTSAEREDTLPPLLSRSHVWLGDAPHALVLDFGVGAGEPQPESPDECVRGVADLMASRQQVLPLHARAALDTLAAGAPLSEVLPLLRESLGRPARVSRRRRLSLLGILAGPAMIAFVVMGSLIALRSYRDPQGAVLNRTLRYLSVSAQASPTAAADRRLAEIYVAAFYPSWAADAASRRSSGVLTQLSRRQQNTASALAARHSDTDSASVSAARRLIEGEWNGRPPGTTRALPELVATTFGFGGGLILAILVIILPPVAVMSCLLALAVRRGPALRALRLDFVTSNGAEAGRLRLFLRALVAWSPVLAVLVVALSAADISEAAYRIGFIFGEGGWMVLAPTVVWLVGVASTLWKPQRGLPDVIAGTHMVPR